MNHYSDIITTETDVNTGMNEKHEQDEILNYCS